MVREDDDTENEPLGHNDNHHHWRNCVGFWVLGLSNNFAYVVMLSAARDILHINPHPNNHTNVSLYIPFPESEGRANTSGRFDCNPTSTAAVLLADILPTLGIKLTAPIFIDKVPYGVRVVLCVVTAVGSFLLVALSHTLWVGLTGVILASVSAGLGEITFLSLSAFYHTGVVSAWSGGTGFAGFLGSLCFSGLTQIGLTPRVTTLSLICVPLCLGLSYFLLLVPTEDPQRLEPQTRPLLTPSPHPPTHTTVPIKHSLREKIFIVKGLLKYMVPLGLVYFAEYFINQGLFELLYFRNTFLDHSDQYRWYQTLYQVGVFVSRSSGKCFQIRKIWILSILQCVNLLLLLCGVGWGYLGSVWVVCVWCVYEGLIGGLAYVNTFNNISREVSEGDREFAMGVASVSDSLGIALSGALALPFHDRMCRLN